MIKLLIVDDEEQIRQVLSEYFVSQNYLVAAAKNGAEAIKILQSEKFDVIVSDYLMPEMTGLELIDYLKGDLAKIPVIWISGNASLTTYRSGWNKGLFDYLEKPLRLEDLKLAVEKALAFGNTKEAASAQP